MSKHAPGPWMVQRYTNHYGFSVFADGKCIAERWYEIEQEEYKAAEIRANARLIAAAPDLLGALENLAIAVSMGWDTDGVMEVARDAIAKAKGETRDE